MVTYFEETPDILFCLGVPVIPMKLWVRHNMSVRFKGRVERRCATTPRDREECRTMIFCNCPNIAAVPLLGQYVRSTEQTCCEEKAHIQGRVISGTYVTITTTFASGHPARSSGRYRGTRRVFRWSNM